jgi:hypothetical protein
MKYTADLFKIIIFVFIMYLPLSWLSRSESIKTLDRIAETETLSKLNSVRNTTKLLLEKNEMLEACLRLDAEITAKNIATYSVIGPENSCYKPEGMSALPPITENGKAVSFVVRDIPLTFLKLQTGNYNWSISVLTPQKINIWNQLKNNVALREELIKDLILVIYIVFSFILCAVLIFAESIQNRYKLKGKDPLWLKILTKVFGFLQLNDIKVIQTATGALIKQNEELNKDIDLLETSLEFSVLNEIKKNNHTIPYSFYGTVSKVDINGFSKVVAAGQGGTTQQMTMNLENFGCELLQRYEGLFEKTIGDEIVVVFKGQDSQKRAMAFSRDLMLEFSQIDFPVDHEKRRFTLKSAIYSSDITFSKRTAGYGFLGDALTFTTRLMDAVTIKEHNILSITSAQVDDIKQLVQVPAQTENFKFKNMADQSGYQISEFLDIEFILTNYPDQIQYFRADQHIIYLLNQIQQKSLHVDIILSALLKINVRVSSEKVIQAWEKTLQTINSNKYLSASQHARLISLGKNLIPDQAWHHNNTEALLQTPRDIEGRINASVIDVLMEKDLQALEKEDQASFRIPNDPSGRTQANILVFQALQKLDNKVFDQLIEMIKSPHAHISKSGIYASCQIIAYYKVKNPAALATYPSYEKMTDLLLKIKGSTKIKLSERLQERLDSIT